MSVQSQYEKEEELIDDQYSRGQITADEHRILLDELRRDYRAAAREAAQEAAERELEKW